MAKAKKKTARRPAVSSRRTSNDAKRLEPDLDAALKLALSMMAIPGKSGQEVAIAEFVTEKLLRAGVSGRALKTDKAYKKTPIDGKQGNLILKLPGTVHGKRRLLMAHLDTVPICVGAKPVRKGNFIRSADPKTGLGADDRAGAAVVLHTALEIIRRGLPHPPLTFLWTVQEEIGLYGARNVNFRDLGNPPIAFNWDGGAPDKMTIGATGGYRLAVDIYGRASHAGAAPEEGISAITIASLAIADLQEAGWHGAIEKPNGCGTSNIGSIEGGRATNVVTEHVRILAEARSHDPKFRRRIVREIEQAFRRAARRVKNIAGRSGRVEIEGHLDYESFRLDEKETCVCAATEAARSIGMDPTLAIANGGLDANWMSARGIPTVTMGCGQMHFHTVDERLNIKQFQQACRVALCLATDSTN